MKLSILFSLMILFSINGYSAEYTKLDDTTLQVTKTLATPSPTSNDYTLDFLKQQELDILKQRNEYIIARDKELVEVRELIAQAIALGIKTSLEIETEKEATLTEEK